MVNQWLKLNMWLLCNDRFACRHLHRFLKLPPWVKLIMTSRKEPLQKIREFEQWNPKEIFRPSSENMDDLKELLEKKMDKCSYMSVQQKQFAISVMAERSQVSVTLYCSSLHQLFQFAWYIRYRTLRGHYCTSNALLIFSTPYSDPTMRMPLRSQSNGCRINSPQTCWVATTWFLQISWP